MFYANIQVMYNPSYSQLKDLHVYAGKNGQTILIISPDTSITELVFIWYTGIPLFI